MVRGSVIAELMENDEQVGVRLANQSFHCLHQNFIEAVSGRTYAWHAHVVEAVHFKARAHAFTT